MAYIENFALKLVMHQKSFWQSKFETKADQVLCLCSCTVILGMLSLDWACSEELIACNSWLRSSGHMRPALFSSVCHIDMSCYDMSYVSQHLALLSRQWSCQDSILRQQDYPLTDSVSLQNETKADQVCTITPHSQLLTSITDTEYDRAKVPPHNRRIPARPW